MTLIHPTAIVHDGAAIGEGTSIGAYSVIGPRVVLGPNNRIGPHVVIEGTTTFGAENQVFQFASVGSAPQDLKYRGEESTLVIGNRNLIREFVTLQPGTKGGGMTTTIGSGNLFMANSHVGHDGRIGDNNVFANSAALAGHVTVGSWVTVGGLCGIHQFVRLGDYSLIGGGSGVSHDVPPYCIAEGGRARLASMNIVRLQRAGFSEDDIGRFKRFFRALVSGEGGFADRLRSLVDEYRGFHMVETFSSFVAESSRGICSFRRNDRADP